MPGELARPSAASAPWAFLTNHLLVLVAIARSPDLRLREVAGEVGITERSAQSIVADLVAAGYVTRSKVGRRNRYAVHLDRPLRHPLAECQPVGALVELLTADDQASGSAKGSAKGSVGPAEVASAGSSAASGANAR